MQREIPLVDLTSALAGDASERVRTGRHIDRICTEIGFFTITGHGVPRDVILSLNCKAHEFFALPIEEKQKVMPVDIKTPRGYKPMGYEALGTLLSANGDPDLSKWLDALVAAAAARTAEHRADDWTVLALERSAVSDPPRALDQPR